jgi:hypothetical protein
MVTGRSYRHGGGVVPGYPRDPSCQLLAVNAKNLYGRAGLGARNARAQPPARPVQAWSKGD